MKNAKREIGRAALYAGVIGSMVLSLLPVSALPAAAQGNTRKINNFDVAGRFLEVWSARGNDQANTYVNGLPITARRPETSVEDGKVYETQWFERAKYEAHPENKAPYDVLLGRLGANFVEGRGSVDPASKQVRNQADRAFVGIDKPADAKPADAQQAQAPDDAIDLSPHLELAVEGTLQEVLTHVYPGWSELAVAGRTGLAQVVGDLGVADRHDVLGVVPEEKHAYRKVRRLTAGVDPQLQRNKIVNLRIAVETVARRARLPT